MTVRHLLSRLAVAAGWTAVVPLTLAAGSHLMRREGSTLAVLLSAVTPVLYVPAYAALAVALTTRRRALAVVSGAIVLGHLVWVLPPLVNAGTSVSAATAGTPLRVFAANVLLSNPRPEVVAREAVELDADVVVLLEVQPKAVPRLTDELQPTHPHLVEGARPGSDGWAVYSRWPLTLLAEPEIAGWPFPRLRLKPPGNSSVELWPVHTLAPMPDILDGWHEQLRRMDEELSAGRPCRLVLAGDFNATRWNASFARLLDAGMSDARSVVGTWAPSWPSDRAFPPVLELDHVLVSRDVAVREFQLGRGAGSDHRPVLVDLIVLERSSCP